MSFDSSKTITERNAIRDYGDPRRGQHTPGPISNVDLCPDRLKSLGNSSKNLAGRPWRLTSLGEADPRLSVRQRLRANTAEIHEALHHHPGFVSLLEMRITPLEYRGLLARLYGFHETFERFLHVASPEVLRGLSAHKLERTSALRADLRALGMSGFEIDALPLCKDLRPVRSRTELMGRMYVVEGSALGGRVMASKLDGMLGVGNMRGRTFLAGRSAPDPLPWPDFCRLLETLNGPTDVEDIIESAMMTFRILADWLNHGCSHG